MPRALLHSSVVLGLIAACGYAGSADAATCASLASPVYIAGSGVATVGQLQMQLAAAGYTIVYIKEESCLALRQVVNGTTLAADGNTMGTIVNGTCTLDATTVPDLALSDVFASTCGVTGMLQNGVTDTFGPIEGYTFVVPKASTEQSISLEAAYFIFGFGNASGAAPWTDETSLFIRDPNSGTELMFATAIGVPAMRWKGKGEASSATLSTDLAAAANPAGALGILTDEVFLQHRATLNILAYQDAGQSCGYFPDSTATAYDKVNVRDGHYALWGPLHMITNTPSGGMMKPGAAHVLHYLAGTEEPPFDLITFLAGIGLVPGCAMKVSRSSEVGPLSSYMPPLSCGCSFERAMAASGPSQCMACTSANDCGSATMTCYHGYCEPKV